MRYYVQFFLICLLLLKGLFAAEKKTDIFGSIKFYQTKEDTIEWNSSHWNNGEARDINWNGDRYDPYGWTENHSGGSADPFFRIDGNGVIQMMSTHPQFQINSMKGTTQQFYKNVEVTGYYRHSSSVIGPDTGGMIIGVRSGPLGHASSGGNDCDASTYYARFRNDGLWDFEKEWKHPGSFYQSEGTIGKQTPLWGGKKLPTNKWIGMKFIVYNPTSNSVKLELFIDKTSNGVPEDAIWEKVGEALDKGKDWSGAGKGVTTISGCKDYNGLVDAYSPILEGHGTVMLKTEGIENNQINGEYKYVTIREIDPTSCLVDIGNYDKTENEKEKEKEIESEEEQDTQEDNHRDVFGSKNFFPKKKGSIEWNSAHWNNGIPRSFNYEGDIYDPLGWTENHSAGKANPYFKIDGKGILQMMSSNPRFSINSSKGTRHQFFKNVEFTGYYRRGEATLNGIDWGGMVVGVRTGPNGHGSSEGNDCDASTYYARFHHDGKWDFEKEWKHPASFYQSNGKIGRQSLLWGGQILPAGKWIGMKYIVYNPTSNSVKLELYIDRTSDGFPEKAVWEKVGEALDKGKDWSGAGDGVSKIEGCEDYNGLIDAYAPILEGHGTVLMRTDAYEDNQIQAEYKYVTVREIEHTNRYDDNGFTELKEYNGKDQDKGDEDTDETVDNENQFDSFGFEKFYRTKIRTTEWNSEHWNNGEARDINWSGDRYDPYGWTENHSGGSADPFFKIDGNGIMQMMSTYPQFQINSLKGTVIQFFKNVEITAFYRHSSTVTSNDKGGMIIGVRSGPLGHGSNGGNDCDASTYYARFRHDGLWDFFKEWKHPTGFYQSSGIVGKQTPLWEGERFPSDKWIGMKFIVYNPTSNSVKLELFIDKTSNGVPEDAIWEKVGEALDEGNDWSGAEKGVSTIEGCEDYNGLVDAYSPILEGHGTVMLKGEGSDNNQINGEYKYVTIREIVPTKPFT